MKFVKYTKYIPDPFGDLSADELMNMLQEFLLESGFHQQFHGFQEMGSHHTLDKLHRALLEALADRNMIPEDLMKQWLENPESYEKSRLSDMIDRLMEKMAEEGYIRVDEPPDSGQLTQPGAGSASGPEGKVKFQLTDKSLDFLGYKALKDLLGSLGKSSIGRHDTQELATGIETFGPSKKYEFGDMLNLDVNRTLLNVIEREGLQFPLPLEYGDLEVRQCEYQSSCATVLMLDCSHSMILYGEDRFTPAKRVALALTHLIRTQYPGDTLHLVLFHDTAEQVPLARLAQVEVGPYYTNTCEGLRLAQRILAGQRKDMKQIILITDGKPSALTLADGRIYKNPFGLDPLVVSETLKEVANCRRSGVMINTFMLASDYELINFVQKVSQMCRGKAYFTTPYTLGQYLLMDFMEKKVRTIH